MSLNPKGFLLVLLIILFFTSGCSQDLGKEGFGKLIILSEPEGAEVYIDGDYKGLTPLQIGKEDGLKVGEVRIFIKKEGYISKEIKAVIEEEKENIVEVVLLGIGFFQDINDTHSMAESLIEKSFEDDPNAETIEVIESLRLTLLDLEHVESISKEYDGRYTLDIYYKEGYFSKITLFDEKEEFEDFQSSKENNIESTPLQFGEVLNYLEGNKVLIWSPARWQATPLLCPGEKAKDILMSSNIDFQVDHYVNEDANINIFEKLTDYDAIIIGSAHGSRDTLVSGEIAVEDFNDCPYKEFRVNLNFTDPVVYLHTLSLFGISRTVYAFNIFFFDQLFNGKSFESNLIVINTSCNGGYRDYYQDRDWFNAFKEKMDLDTEVAYYGYDGAVTFGYAYIPVLELLTNLLEGDTTGEAYVERTDWIGNRGTKWVMYGSDEIELFPKEINFADSNLEQVVRDAINKPSGPIYISDVNELEELYAEGRGIESLEGIQYFQSLTTLRLGRRTFEDKGEYYYNYIDDISLISNLFNLELLSINHNQLSDLSYLSNLTNLILLSFGGNEVSDISFLADLTKLEHLSFVNIKIDDISELSALENLIVLFFTGNQVNDISPLSNLTNLRTLGFYSNEVSDISPLTNLTNLEWLSFWDNEVSDISPLSNLTNLRALGFFSNEVSDISPLTNLTNLEWLSFAWNEVSDISALVANEGFGSGDRIHMPHNYLDLDDDAVMDDINELIGRGVEVEYEPQREPGETDFVVLDYLEYEYIYYIEDRWGIEFGKDYFPDN